MTGTFDGNGWTPETVQSGARRLPDQWTIRLLYPRPPKGLHANDRVHHMALHRAKQMIRDEVFYKVRAAKVPALERIRVDVVWWVKDGQKRDVDGLDPFLKVIYDARGRHPRHVREAARHHPPEPREGPVLRGHHRRPGERRLMPKNEAYVDDYRTYFAVCDDCRWEGREYEDDMLAAQKEADEHECEPTDETEAAETEDDEADDGVMPPPMFDLDAVDPEELLPGYTPPVFAPITPVDDWKEALP